MKIETALALDPSSSCTGYAVMAVDDYRLLAGGVLKPNHAEDKAFNRIEDMVGDLIPLLHEKRPDVILIEWTAGKVAGRLQEKKNIPGLAIYGIAVGSFWREVHRYCRDWNGAIREGHVAGTRVDYELIEENDWTRQIPKPERLQTVAALYGQYDPAQDKGGDLGDAIGLARYYLEGLKFN